MKGVECEHAKKNVVRTRIELVTSSVWKKRDNHYTNAPITKMIEINVFI